MDPMIEQERWPEHYRLNSHDEDRCNRRDAIEGFLEWLEERGIVLAKLDKYEADYVKVENPKHHLVAESLGVDIEKLKAEEQDMIQYAIDYFKTKS